MAISSAILFDSALDVLFTAGGTWWDDATRASAFVLVKDSLSISGTLSTYGDIAGHEVTDPDYAPIPCANRTVTRQSGVLYFSSDAADFGSTVTITAKYLVCLYGDSANLSGTDPLLWYVDLNTGSGSVQVQSALFRVTPAQTPVAHWFYLQQG